MSTLTSTTIITSAPVRNDRKPEFLTTLKTVVSALGDGLRAYHRYEQLRAQGVPHAVAATRSLEG